MMVIKIIDIKSKECIKELEIDIKKEIDSNKDIIKMAKMMLGFTNAKLFDIFLNSLEKSEHIVIVSFVHRDKFKPILDKIEE